MNLKRSAIRDRDAFLDLVDPSLRLLDHPAQPRGEVDRVAALALLISIASLVPLAGGVAAAIGLAAKMRA